MWCAGFIVEYEEYHITQCIAEYEGTYQIYIEREREICIQVYIYL